MGEKEGVLFFLFFFSTDSTRMFKQKLKDWIKKRLKSVGYLFPLIIIFIFFEYGMAWGWWAFLALTIVLGVWRLYRHKKFYLHSIRLLESYIWGQPAEYFKNRSRPKVKFVLGRKRKLQLMKEEMKKRKRSSKQ